MKNMNNAPNMIAIAPITTLKIENCGCIILMEIPLIIEAIPKNNKLSPMIIETSSELNIGHIIKIRPNNTNNIPKILLRFKFIT